MRIQASVLIPVPVLVQTFNLRELAATVANLMIFLNY